MSEVMSCPVSYWAQRTPDAPAVMTDKVVYSYRQLEEKVLNTGGMLMRMGIMPGMRVGLSDTTSIAYVATLLALWRIGAVVVPINERFPDAAKKAIVEKLAVHFFIKPSEVSFFPLKVGEVAPPMVDLGRDAAIILTSGSTGIEKGVLLSYGNLYYNALGSNRNIRLRRGDRWLLALPLYHVGGLGIVFRVFLAGSVVVIPAVGEDLENTIVCYRVTHLSLVATQLYRLLECSSRRVFPTLKAMLLGGSAFSEGMIKEAYNRKFPIFASYGMSEMASQVTTTPVNVSLANLFTSGRRLGYRRIKTSQEGEIMVKGLTRFQGYVKENGIEQPFDKNGWFATGDLGFIDETGYLHVMGRKDNMFISGGENILPEEIEQVLVQVPGIEKVVVVPVENAEFGFRPVAFLKVVASQLVTRQIIFQVLEFRLPRFKVPDVFYGWPDIEEEGLSKVKRPYFKQLAAHPEELTILFRK